MKLNTFLITLACISLTACSGVHTPTQSEESLGALVLTEKRMVQRNSSAQIPPSSEHVVVNSASPYAHLYAKDSNFTSKQYLPELDDPKRWVVMESAKIKPTSLEAVAGAEIQNGLLGSVYFDLNKSDIDDDDYLSKLATKLKRISGPIAIFGFTDPTGTEARNHVLAQERANAVKEKLVSYGLNESRINASGGGISRLYADNSRNRRAAIFLTIQE